MPIRSKLMLGLLTFATVPLVLLGWFVCMQVNRARRSAVMQVQAAEHKSIGEMRGLSRRAARAKAEEIATQIVLFLNENPGADLTELRCVEFLKEAAQQQATVGYTTFVELLLNDRPVDFLGARPNPEPAPESEPSQPDTATSSGEPAKAYAYVADVPGTRLKVAIRVKNTGLEKTVDELVRSIQGIGDATERETNRAMDKLKVMLVVGVTGLVVGLTLVGGEVARTITKPIQKLTAAAEKIRRGERHVDLAVGGGRELQLLADAFTRATSELQSYANSLERTNLELDVARRLEAKACQELKEAQDEMIQMEKMSSLGRLVAGVAHEINTPTGAIYNVTAEAAGALDTLVNGLHRMREMSAEDFDVFRHFLDVAVARRLQPERVPRKERTALRTELEKAGIREAKKCTELLARCHLTVPSEGVELCRLLEKYAVADVFTALVEIHASAKISRTSAEKISQTVRALKFYSHGGEQAAPVSTDINQTIQDTLVILHNRLKTRADVTVELEEGLPSVRCTGGITEVWVNLLTNACDAIEERGEGERGRIRVKSFRTDDGVQVIVSDDGQPVPPGVASKIFDPFFTTKPPGKGAGLGLSVVMGTIKRNGGTVTLQNNGDFKEFSVTLPLERATHGATV